MNSRKFNRRLQNVSTRRNETSIIDDLFGLEINGNDDDESDSESDETGTGTGPFANRRVKPKKKKVKKCFMDIPEKVLENIFSYMKQLDLKSLRLVSKKVSAVATEVFQEIHNPITINTDNDIFRFKHDMDTSAKFPFSRFCLVLQHIPRHMLITFTRRYEEYIKYLRIEPFDKNGDGAQQQMMEPSLRPLEKLTGVIQELNGVEDLYIVFPTLSDYDYNSLEFEKDYELDDLKIFSVSFSMNGFSRFSSDLTINILHHADNLEKLWLKLPEPTDAEKESLGLYEVLKEAARVPTVAITLIVNSSTNILLETISHTIETGVNTRIRKMVILLGIWINDYKGIIRMLYCASGILKSLSILRRRSKGESKPINHGSLPYLYLPEMYSLRKLAIDSYQIPTSPLQVQRFPNLISLELHLKYGDDEFYKHSTLHPLLELKLHFHETSIMRVHLPEFYMDRLVSKDLRKLELVNPPPGHLTFMSNWGKDIETLILSAPSAYGEDPTYPTEKVLGQLNGMMQFRDGFYNHIGLLGNLVKLHLLLPIDENMAELLADLPKLWELIVDDSIVSENAIRRMRYRHYIYLSRRAVL